MCCCQDLRTQGQIQERSGHHAHALPSTLLVDAPTMKKHSFHDAEVYAGPTSAEMRGLVASALRLGDQCKNQAHEMCYRHCREQQYEHVRGSTPGLRQVCWHRSVATEKEVI